MLLGSIAVQLFEDLLGPDLSRDLAAVSLNVTLEWCNSTMATLEVHTPFMSDQEGLIALCTMHADQVHCRR